MTNEIKAAIEKVKKLRRQSESEAKLENFGAAELFREKADELFVKYSLSEEMLAEIAEATIQNELGISLVANPFLRSNARTNLRSLQFEELAKVVAEGYACKSIPTDEGSVKFFGYDLDREISIFMFLSLMEIAENTCKLHMKEARDDVGKPPVKALFGGKSRSFPQSWMGDETFVDSFHTGFRFAIFTSYTKHELDSTKVSKVKEFFIEKVGRHYTDYNAPKASSLNEEIVALGEKVGTSIAKKARNAPSALTTTRNSPTIKSRRILDVETRYICIDNSASMRFGEVIGEAKEGAKNFLRESVRNGAAVGLVKFGEGAKHLLHPQQEIDSRFEKAIDKLDAREGSTDMASAIQVAQAHLLNRRKKRVICIVTDGMPNNREFTLQVASDAKRDGIEIIAIGVEGADEEFLKKLASREGLGMLVDRTRLALTMGEMAK